MRRKIAKITIATLVAPLVLSAALTATSASASGGDDDHDESDDDESPESSVPGSSIPVLSVPVPSVPGSPAPGASLPGDRVREIVQALDRAIEALKKSSAPASVKASLVPQLEAIRERITSRQAVSQAEVQAVLDAVRAALSPVISTPSTLPGAPVPSTSVPTAPGVPSIPGSTVPSGGSRRTEVLKAIQKMVEQVQKSSLDPQTKQQLLATMQGLVDRINSGQVPASDEIERVLKAAEKVLKALRPGTPSSLPGNDDANDGSDDDGSDDHDGNDDHGNDDSVVTVPGSDDGSDDVAVPERSQPSPDQLRARMLAVVDEALRLLDGRTTDEALAAITALQAVKTSLEAGELPSREVFEEARRLAREALETNPADQALVTLAGVIAAVQQSNAPDSVKQAILAVLEAARQTILSDPTVDPQEVVHDALERVRDLRVAESVRKLVELSNRLEAIAVEQGNSAAVSLIDQAQALLTPVDGSLPNRDDVHRAKRLLRRAAHLLRPPTTSTVPGSSTTVAPSTSVPDTSVDTTTAPPTTV